RKDFMIEPYQIWESRAAGADAVLLIVAALETPRLAELLALSRKLGMDALVEVHSEGELETAVAVGADIIGINNRDLATLRVSLDTSYKLLPLLRGRALGVAESGIESWADCERVRAAGACAVLIGTAFCAAPDIEGKVREVMGW
ncbi:MAG: indole-3-glycerol-phosphate synthase, partial [Fimbriimonas ginsengisoli]|nr:indole-3-glycerol-phosphate synthase [Fimbriimonas ginsengisoli]